MIRTADNIEHVKQMVCADHRLMVRMIDEELSINKDTVWSIITENLEMRKVCAKMVPKLLSAVVPSCCSPRSTNRKESLSVKTLSSASRTIQTCSGES